MVVRTVNRDHILLLLCACRVSRVPLQGQQLGRAGTHRPVGCALSLLEDLKLACQILFCHERAWAVADVGGEPDLLTHGACIPVDESRIPYF